MDLRKTLKELGWEKVEQAEVHGELIYIYIYIYIYISSGRTDHQLLGYIDLEL